MNGNLIPIGVLVRYNGHRGFVTGHRIIQNKPWYMIKHFYFYNHPEQLGMTEEVESAEVVFIYA